MGGEFQTTGQGGKLVAEGNSRDKPLLSLEEDELNSAWISTKEEMALKMACLVTEV